MTLVEEAHFAEQFDVFVAHPHDRFDLVLLEVKHLCGHVALHHVKQRKLIFVASDSHQLELTFRSRKPDFLPHLAQHGHGEVALATLHMTRSGGVIVALALCHLLNQVLAFVVVDIDRHDGNHHSGRDALSPLDGLSRRFQVFVVQIQKFHKLILQAIP